MMASGFVLVPLTVRTWVDVDQVTAPLSAFSVSVGATVRPALADTGPIGAHGPCYDAPNVTVVTAETPLPGTPKVADVWPAATVTVAGTLAADELADKATTTPPAGAGWLIVIVPLVITPGPIIAYGLSV